MCRHQPGKLDINLAHFDINTMPDLEAAGRSLLDTNTLKVYDDPRSPAGRHSAHPLLPLLGLAVIVCLLCVLTCLSPTLRLLLPILLLRLVG